MPGGKPAVRKRNHADGDAGAFCAAAFTARPPALRMTPRPGTRDPEALRAVVEAHGLPASARDSARRNRVLEGLALLWHDHWEAAHEIAQSMEGDPDHDLLHAMVHRREGDHGNAGYWFGGARKHPGYRYLAEGLSVLPLAPAMRAGLLPEGSWSPAAFNEEVRRHDREDPEAVESLVMIQAEEFRAFAWSLFASGEARKA